MKIPFEVGAEAHWLVLAGLALAAFFVIKAAEGMVKVVLWVLFFSGAMLLAKYFLK